VLLLGMLGVACCLRLLVGSGWTLSWPSDAAILDLRLSRLALGLVVGGCLGAAGAMLQSLLRNPLASPDLLGVSPAATLSVLLVGVLRSTESSAGGLSLIAWNAAPALAGALLALGLLYTLSRRWSLGTAAGGIDPGGLILVGVMLSVMCGAATMLVQHLFPSRAGGGATLRLLVGSLSDDTPRIHLLLAAGTLAVGLVIGVSLSRAMDALSMGDDEALSVGVPVARTRLLLYLLTGLLTAAGVVVAGPVAFIGLLSPHVVRLLAGMEGGHRLLILGGAIAGATLVVLADAVVKLVDLSTGRLPLGVLTALIGGPLFIVLLRRRAG
jgi:iron complex transport system permease protein